MQPFTFVLWRCSIENVHVFKWKDTVSLRKNIYALLMETWNINCETWEFLQLCTLWNMTKCSSLVDWIRIASRHIELLSYIRMCLLNLIMKDWCKVFPFLNVYQNFFLFQKSSECWMCVSLQECNKLIKAPAKSILLTGKNKKKKAGISFFWIFVLQLSTS